MKSTQNYSPTLVLDDDVKLKIIIAKDMPNVKPAKNTKL